MCIIIYKIGREGERQDDVEKSGCWEERKENLIVDLLI